MRSVIRIVTDKPMNAVEIGYLEFNGLNVKPRKNRFEIVGLPEDFSDIFKNDKNVHMGTIIDDLSFRYADGDYNWL